MTKPSQPDWVRAWAIVHGCEVSEHPIYDLAGAAKLTWYYQTGDNRSARWEYVPDRDSGDYFKAMVLAAESVCVHKVTGNVPYKYEAWWNITLGSGPDPVGALIAAVLASKGGGK